MSEAMASMGWSPLTLWLFIGANLLIFLAYAILGGHHLLAGSKNRTVAHIRYGAFILACGGSHGVMAWHMVSPAVFVLVASHWTTAVVSWWVVIALERQNE